MKRIVFLSLVLACSFGLQSCLKMGATTEVKNDASATVAFSFQVNTAAIEAIKELVDGVGGGGEEMEQALEAFDQIDELFNEKKIGEKLKEAGLDVTSAKAGSRDGWKTMEVKAAVKDLNAFLKKAEKDQKEEVEDLPIDLPFGDIGSMVPAFYKTSTQGVGKVVLIPAIGDLLNDASFDLEQLEDLADDELEQIEAQIEAMKLMLSLDQLKLEVALTLPGKVVKTKGCKKVGENGLKFALKGGDLNIDGVRSLFGLKDGVSATFQIPQGCKIVFKDEPTEKKGKGKDHNESEDQKTEKKGGLKIGEGKGKKG